MADDAALDRAFYDDLDGARAEAWRRLARGVADRRSGFHTVQLATIGADGGPRVRTMVLRGVDATARILCAHTDTRSDKATQMAADARAEICAYDSQAKIQIRARGVVAADRDGPAADAAWAGSAPGSRLCYRADHGPGAPLESPAQADPTEAMREAAPDAGRAQFMAILLTVERLEWLYLAARGHRRAAFAWSGTGWRGRWLAP